MKPIINKLLLPPHLKDPLNPNENLLHNTKKFTPLDDNLILIGLHEFGACNEQVQANWLPHRTLNEIKNRFKNVALSKRHDKNGLRRWKKQHGKPLTDKELFLFAKAVAWFGSNTKRW